MSVTQAVTISPRAAPDGGVSPSQEVLAWLEATRNRSSFRVQRVSFRELRDWRRSPGPLRLVHQSGRFFTIEGLRVATDYGPVRTWDQPIINQPEIGILGVITRVIDGTRYYLMQAKAEPGNVNWVQLSPTVQATRSNFTRVHHGRRTPLLEYFTGEARARTIVDELQSEQASRFLGKRNRNMVIEVVEDVPASESFRWLTLDEIKALLRVDNVVNMDARSVISCIPPSAVDRGSRRALSGFGERLLASSARREQGKHSMREIVSWISQMRSMYEIRVSPRDLDDLRGWTMTDDEISHETGRHFRVVGVQVEMTGREVPVWGQPLLHHPGVGLNGMLLQEIDGTLHALVRACLYPGNRDVFELGSTVSRSDYVSHFGAPDAPPFLDYFREPSPSSVRFSSIQSEEGGRFLHYQNMYMIIELEERSVTSLPEGYMWMTIGQIYNLLPHGYFNIEARNLLSVLWYR